MKLSLTLLLLFPLSVFSRLTTMKDTTAIDLSNADGNRVVYFEDSTEEHPEGRRGLVIQEIYQNDKKDLLDSKKNDENEEQETNKEDKTQRALGHYGHNYYHHKKHYKPYYHHKKHYKKHYYYY